MTPKVLVVLTSQNEIPSLKQPTGWYLVCDPREAGCQSGYVGVAGILTSHPVPKPEFAHPHHVLHNKVSLTIASPKGGEAPLDPSSVEMFKSDPTSTTFLEQQKALWSNTHKLADMVPRAGEFDALFYVGGHGRMYSLPRFRPSFPLLVDDMIGYREKIYIFHDGGINTDNRNTTRHNTTASHLV